MKARRGLRRLVLPLAALAVLGGGWGAYAAVAGDGHDYRLAAATLGDVSATVELTGSVSASGRADLVAPATGTVVGVPVAVGRTVRRGAVIARLDQTSLRAQLSAANAALAKAKAQLASDEDAQVAAVEAASSSTSSPTATTAARSSTRASAKPSTPVTTSPDSSPTIATIRSDQAAVTKAQTAASTALTTAKGALADQESACTSTTTDPTTTASADPTASPSATDTGVSGECQDALGAVDAAQTAVATAQQTLADALDRLATDLTKALQAVPSDSSGSPSAAPSEAAGGRPTGSADAANPSTSTPTTSSVTAATLARDQASIDQARSDVVAAQQSLAAAVIRAPAAGQVRSLAVAKGDSVNAGDDVAVLVGDGLTTVDIAASESQVRRLAVGATASVTPAGASKALAGRITRIAHVATTSDDASAATGASTDASYAVVVTLDTSGSAQPAIGMPVGVSVVVGTAKNVVTVPASAVSSGSVRVLRDGVVARQAVTTGVVGTSRVQVLDGLDVGDEVVLADLDEDLPGSDSSSGQGGFGGNGTFTGPAGGGPPGFGGAG